MRVFCNFASTAALLPAPGCLRSAEHQGMFLVSVTGMTGALPKVGSDSDVLVGVKGANLQFYRTVGALKQFCHSKEFFGHINRLRELIAIFLGKGDLDAIQQKLGTKL